MSGETRDRMEAVLQNVKSSRRDLLKRLLIGSGAALLIPMSSVLANAKEPGQGKGKKGKRGKKGKKGAKGKKGKIPPVADD